MILGLGCLCLPNHTPCTPGVVQSSLCCGHSDLLGNSLPGSVGFYTCSSSCSKDTHLITKDAGPMRLSSLLVFPSLCGGGPGSPREQEKPRNLWCLPINALYPLFTSAPSTVGPSFLGLSFPIYSIGGTTGISLGVGKGGGAVCFKRSSLLSSSGLLTTGVAPAVFSSVGTCVPLPLGVPSQAGGGADGPLVSRCPFRGEDEVAARSQSATRHCPRPASRGAFSVQ